MKSSKLDTSKTVQDREMLLIQVKREFKCGLSNGINRLEPRLHLLVKRQSKSVDMFEIEIQYLENDTEKINSFQRSRIGRHYMGV